MIVVPVVIPCDGCYLTPGESRAAVIALTILSILGAVAIVGALFELWRTR